jgi:Na+/H+ antiporter NhaC
MGKHGHKKTFRLKEVIIYFLLGAGIAACYTFYTDDQVDLITVIKYSLYGAILSIAVYFIAKYFWGFYKKKLNRKRRSKRNSDNREYIHAKKGNKDVLW